MNGAAGMVRLGRAMIRVDRVLLVMVSPAGHVRLSFDTGQEMTIPADYLEGEFPFSVWQKPRQKQDRQDEQEE